VNLRETIKEIVKDHLENQNGLVMGQCLTAVGWVGGTLPEIYEDGGMVELSMADVANGGFAVGAALSGRRPMYVIRYQGFNWFNAPIIINYACKSNEIWGRPCPLFVRSIAMEGAIGPVAGSSHHSMYFRMPGMKIYSPMSPNEYKLTYSDFMKGQDVFYVSEHRGSYDNCEDLIDINFDNPHYVLFPISITRFDAVKASHELIKEGIKVSVCHIFIIKPFLPSNESLDNLKNSTYGGCVIDDDYVDGIAKSISNDLANATGNKVEALGLENKSAGFAKDVDNLPPDFNKIIAKVRNAVK